MNLISGKLYKLNAKYYDPYHIISKNFVIMKINHQDILLYLGIITHAESDDSEHEVETFLYKNEIVYITWNMI